MGLSSQAIEKVLKDEGRPLNYAEILSLFFPAGTTKQTAPHRMRR